MQGEPENLEDNLNKMHDCTKSIEPARVLKEVDYSSHLN